MRAPAAKSVVDGSVWQSTAADIKLMAAAASHIHGHWHEQSGFLVPQCALITDVHGSKSACQKLHFVHAVLKLPNG
ncbi:hypothetical protein [Novosphingobium nitrogenifigens]|uniref:hypothetical protein n=1 Tax=Novosphingobium nitrogenifigens TaxID=378548 RepID=UPI0012F49388|nr:hypothetical protein [Novosphingobium nitrogenifigens]